MIKNLKCRLAEHINGRRVLIGGIALMLAITVSVATLFGLPIHTAEIFKGQKIYSLSASYSSHMVAPATTIVKSYPVYITCGENTVVLDFTGGTVADALSLAGFSADSNDFVTPALDTVIDETVYIDYSRIDYVTSTVTEAIAFETQTVYDKSLDKGYSAVTQKGAEGVQEVTYTEKLVNGVSTEKTVTSTTVLSNPTNAVKVVGTKEESVKTSADVKTISTLTPNFEIKLDANGNPVNYKSKTTVRATAYTYTGNNCSTGVAPQPGYIAVNPNVIPYGTKMYIKSADGSIVYGYAVAADTGGFIRRYPNGIDLFMSTQSACTSFGVRNMEVYILE